MDENSAEVLTEQRAKEALDRIGCLRRLARRPGQPVRDPVWSHLADAYQPPERVSGSLCKHRSGPATGGGRICNPVQPDPSIW